MRGKQAINLLGKKFGSLVVIGRAPNQVCSDGNMKQHQKAVWICQCDCGSEPKAIRADHLTQGRTVSCGCVGYRHARDAKVKHGGSNTDRLYSVWYDMRQRCRNPKIPCYKNYGGRGIAVCEEWNDDYGAFREWAYAHGYDPNAEYGKCTIDRIDVNGNYCPENCRFVDMKTQSNNRRPRASA